MPRGVRTTISCKGLITRIGYMLPRHLHCALINFWGAMQYLNWAASGRGLMVIVLFGMMEPRAFGGGVQLDPKQ
jgi:hypothetical protein